MLFNKNKEIKKKYHLFKKRDMPVIDDSDYETSAAEQCEAGCICL